MEFFLKAEDGKIKDASFQAIGCAIGLCVRSVKFCPAKKRLGRYIKEKGFEEIKRGIL